MKKRYRYWIFLAALTLLGSVTVQVIWIVKGYEQSQAHLTDQLERALSHTIEDLTLAEEIAFISQIESKEGDSGRVEVVEYRFLQDSAAVWDEQAQHKLEEDLHVISGVVHESVTQHKEDGKNNIRVEVHSDGHSHRIDTVVEEEDVLLEDVLEMERNGRLQSLVRRIRVENIRQYGDLSNRIDSARIHEKLHENLVEQSINLPFAFEVVNSAGQRFADMASGSMDEGEGVTASAPLFPADLRSKDVILHVRLSAGFGALFQEIAWLTIFSFLFTAIMLLLFVLLWRQLLSQAKLSQMKTDFIGNMSHELRTPLATISLAADSIAHPKNAGNTASVLPLVATIKREHDRIHRHVDRVLQMAHADQGAFMLERTQVALPEWLMDIVQGYAQRAASEQKSITLKTEVDEFIVEWDDLHMRSAIENLIDNAFNYNPAGTEVVVSLERAEGLVVISVVDNGVGIAKDEQELVFERFYRTQTGNLHEVKGFGLGLSYVRLVCDAHGGVLNLQSTAGEGSTFTMKIPDHG